MINLDLTRQQLWETGDGPTRAYLLYLSQAETRTRGTIGANTADSYYTNWTDAAHYRTYYQGEGLSTVWRGIDGRFTCTECGQAYILCPGASQTLDGYRKLCRACNDSRIAAIWANRPAGLYAINMCDRAGVVLTTDYVFHGGA